MTFLTWTDALAACDTQKVDLERASELFSTAYDQLVAARDRLAEEDSPWDGSTYGSVAAVGGIILTCAGPVRGTLCLGGLLVGTIGLSGSEIDRESDIEAAQAAVDQAQLLLDFAERELREASSAFGSCMAHHVTKSA